jgi:hypothetical protein
MHAVIRRYANGSALADALGQRRQEVQELISGVPGFRHYAAIRAGNEVATVTICDDAAGTSESSRRAREWVQKNLAGASLSAPEMMEGDIVLEFGA